jgi:hypothetical protein
VAGTGDYAVLEPEDVGINSLVSADPFRAVGIVVAGDDDRWRRGRLSDGRGVDATGKEGAVGSDEGRWAWRGGEDDAIDTLLGCDFGGPLGAKGDAAAVCDHDSLAASKLSELAVQDRKPLVESRRRRREGSCGYKTCSPRQRS